MTLTPPRFPIPERDHLTLRRPPVPGISAPANLYDPITLQILVAVLPTIIRLFVSKTAQSPPKCAVSQTIFDCTSMKPRLTSSEEWKPGCGLGRTSLPISAPEQLVGALVTLCNEASPNSTAPRGCGAKCVRLSSSTSIR